MIKEKFQDTKFGKVNYLEIGTGEKTLVYFHGWFGNPTPAIQLSDFLLPNGYQIICPYLPGHGDSFDLNPNFSFPDLIETFEDFIEKLGIKNVDMVGHSVGGTLAYELANKNSNLSRRTVGINCYNNFNHYGELRLIPLWFHEAIKTIKEKSLDSSQIPSQKRVRFSTIQIDKFLRTFSISSVQRNENDFLFIWGSKDELSPKTEWIKSTGIKRDRILSFDGNHCWGINHVNEIGSAIENFFS